ncbi:MAG: hypothetical protein HQ594_03510 [Candidatus Omnitrophica bacterium]|nr:hypothetical protein [Candidatus Omnitrophota bacterium]
MNERIAEVKQYLKTMPGSKYMADRRITKKDDHLTLQVFNNDESLIENYKPLGQILIDKDLLTQEDLDNALKMHWKRGVLLGEVIKEMGLVSENDIRDALSSQENYLEAGNLKDAPAIQTKN